DTAAAKSRISTSGLANRPTKVLSRLFRLAPSISLGPTFSRIEAASDALRPATEECRLRVSSETERLVEPEISNFDRPIGLLPEASPVLSGFGARAVGRRISASAAVCGISLL